MVVDFREIPDGETFEDFVEDLFVDMGCNPKRTGRGPDSGCDFIIEIEKDKLFYNVREYWLVECRHHAHSAKSVTPNEIGSMSDLCTQHKADGYLLVTSTLPSANLQKRIDAIASDRALPFSAAYLKRNRLTDLVLERPHLLQKYFPNSYRQLHGPNIILPESDLISLFDKLYKRNPTSEEIRSIVMHTIRFNISDIHEVENIITDPEVTDYLNNIYELLLLRKADPTGLFVYGFYYKTLPPDQSCILIQESIKQSEEYNKTAYIRVPEEILNEMEERIYSCVNCQPWESGSPIWVVGREYGSLEQLIDEIFDQHQPEYFDKFSRRAYSYEIDRQLLCPHCGTELDRWSIVGECDE